MKILHSSAAKIFLGALAVILLLTAAAASFLSVIIYAGDVDRMSQAALSLRSSRKVKGPKAAPRRRTTRANTPRTAAASAKA